jgi:uncharacterized protein (DUF302 family)
VKLRLPFTPPFRPTILASCRFTIFEVCQPQQAKRVLDQNMSVSTALPCRISIYEEDGKTILATLKPTILLAMFHTPQLEGVAQEVEDTLVKIMKEAANSGSGKSLRPAG